MARNDIYININALSPADAVVTGQQDMTAATIPELVLGDTPTFNFYFTDNTNVWPSWAGNAAYTLTWALSDAVAGDFTPAATTANATPITGGWSVVLPLNAYDLVGLLNTKRIGQPFPVQNLWQQLRVADPSGNEITRAMFWTPIRYRAISDTQNTESAAPTGARSVVVGSNSALINPTAATFYAANPVPTSALGTAANGELLIGNGTGFTKSTLTAGTGVSITNASGSITIDATGAQETLTATVKNAESVPITKGQVVYLFGATGNMASVKLAYNTSDATSAKTFGVVADDSISAGGSGMVTCVGVLGGLNLGSFQEGDTLYLGATAGSVTATKPYAPNHLVYVGVVERANNGNGELYVKIQNGYELDEIHDVQINAPRQSGQTLIYDNTLSLWKNARITAGSNIAVTNGDSSISIGFSGTLPVANGGTGVTTSTGTGSVVLSNTPTLTTPILGTPQSATLTNATGLPISTGVSGLGTNVASALGTNVGSAGAFVVNGGALGTPSSGTLTNATGLPISTGVSGLGTGVATFLATPSSANLASAVTDETGTGALVFANTPTLVTPNIGAATGTSFNLTGSGTLGTTLTVNSTTDSSSKDTGAIVTEGGVGIEKKLYVGTDANVGGNVSISGSLRAATNLSLSSVSGYNFFGLNNAQNLTTATGIYSATGDTTLYLNVPTGSTVRARVNGSDQLTVSSTATTLAGNLTVSGTGTSTFSGTLSVVNGSSTGILKLQGANGYSSTEYYNASAVRKWTTGYDGSNDNYYWAAADGSTVAVFKQGGNLLVGTTTDSGNGKLQLATHTTAAGGIGFGTDVSFGRLGGGVLAINHISGTSPTLYFQENGTSKGLIGDSSNSIYINSFSGGITLQTNSTTALTLDSSQNAEFKGKVTIIPEAGASTYIGYGTTLDTYLTAKAAGTHNLRDSTGVNWWTFDRDKTFIVNTTSAPGSNPSGGGYLYVESGALKYRGSSGTVTTIANA